MAHPLLRPRALVRHLIVLTVVVTCVALGQWQLARLAEVRATNARLAERMQVEARDLDALVSSAADENVAADDLEFRRVRMTGTFRPGEEVLQRNRAHLGQSGYHVLTPFETTGGNVVLVRRGWVPPDHDEPPVADAAPPAGEVAVTAILEAPVPQPRFGARDPADGQLDRVFHTDTARLDAQVAGDLFPMVARLTADAPARDGPLPLALGPPQLDEANHQSYAVQWHSFAIIAAVGYGAWTWRQRRTTQR
ncbi:MAG: SURF1 family protein [Nitriliruptoraceae bacterium]